jgi:hypothetical protein
MDYVVEEWSGIGVHHLVIAIYNRFMALLVISNNEELRKCW